MGVNFLFFIVLANLIGKPGRNDFFAADSSPFIISPGKLPAVVGSIRD